jgi:hypothetical protein
MLLFRLRWSLRMLLFRLRWSLRMLLFRLRWSLPMLPSRLQLRLPTQGKGTGLGLSWKRLSRPTPTQAQSCGPSWLTQGRR